MEKEILTLKEAAEFLRFTGISKLREKARKGLIPACKPGRNWVFYKPDLVQWMRDDYTSRREAAQVGIGGKLWQSSRRKAGVSCTPSSHSAVLELMNRRKQIREQKLKSMKRNEEAR